MWHDATLPFHFKTEATLGARLKQEPRAVAAFNLFGLVYLTPLRVGRVCPFFEAGSGVIYTDFQVDGQGLRWNFNPCLGLGLESRDKGGRDWFVSVRAHHVSNAGLDDENRGINTLMLRCGVSF
jgi:hypothetical protein